MKRLDVERLVRALNAHCEWMEYRVHVCVGQGCAENEDTTWVGPVISKRDMRRLLAALDTARAAPQADAGLLDRLERFSHRAEVAGKVDAEQLRKAIAELRAAPATPARLDVDALTQAVFEAERPGDWPTWHDYIGAFGSAGIPPWRRKAERLAAEYARAGSQPSEDGPAE